MGLWYSILMRSTETLAALAAALMVACSTQPGVTFTPLDDAAADGGPIVAPDVPERA